MSSADIWRIESEWATVHATKPATEQNLQTLLDVLGIPAPGNAHGSASLGLAHAIPLATYLIQHQGSGADVLMPALVQCLHAKDIGRGVFSQTKNLDKRRGIVQELLGRCSRVMALEELSSTHKQQLSTASIKLIRTVLQQMQGNGGPVPPAEMEAIQALSLESLAHVNPIRVPVLPHDARDLIQTWLTGDSHTTNTATLTTTTTTTTTTNNTTAAASTGTTAAHAVAAEVAFVRLLVAAMSPWGPSPGTPSFVGNAMSPGGPSPVGTAASMGVGVERSVRTHMASVFLRCVRAHLQPLIDCHLATLGRIDGIMEGDEGVHAHSHSGQELPDGRHVVSAIAFLATLFTPHTTTTSPPQETVPSSAFATDSTHADTPTPTSSGTAEQGAPSKEDVLVLQQACVLAVHAVQAYVGIAAAGGGHGMHTPSALHKVLLLAPHTLSLMQSLLTTYGCTSVAQDCIDTLQAILRVCAVNTHAELTKVNVQENSRGRGHARGMGRGALLAPWRWKLNRSLLQDAEYGPSSWLGVCKSLTELFAHCLAQGRLQGVPPATGSHAAGAPIHPSSSSDVDVSGNTTTNIPSSTTLDNSTTTTTTTTHTEGILPHLHEGPTRDVGSLLLLQLVDPSTSTLGGAELRVMLLVVGRIAMLGHLNLRVLGVIVELLLESIATPTPQLEPLSYGVIIHTLCYIALATKDIDDVTCRKVLRTLLRLYKHTQGEVSKILMAGGACEGVLVDVLRRVAMSLNVGDPRRTELRLATIQAFNEHALSMPAAPSITALENLGWLLPVIAATSLTDDENKGEEMRGVLGASTGSGWGGGGGGGDVDVVQEMMVKEAAVIRLYRLFWLVVALYDFAGLDESTASLPGASSAPSWPPAWRAALGVISAHSPPLILSTRVASASKYDERLEYDLHEPLQRLAVRANPTLLQRALTTLLSGKQQDAVFATLGGGLGGGPGAPQLAPTRLAYLLGVAHSHLSRARLAPQPDAGDMLPLGSLLAQLQVLPSTAPDFGILAAITQATFRAHVQRWQAQHIVGQGGSAVLETQIRVALSLIANLNTRTGSQLVPLMAAAMLDTHAKHVPTLLHHEAVWDALVSAVGEEAQLTTFYPNMVIDGKRPAYEALKRFLLRAHTLAPNLTGLLVQQRLMQHGGTIDTSDGGVVALVQGSTEAPAVNGQRIEELARQQLRDASRVLRSGGGEDSGFSGLDSMLAKTYYSGRVTGMADRAAALGKARDTVLQECVLGVQEATSAGQPLSQLITRFMELAAAIIMFPNQEFLGEAIHTLAYTPAAVLNCQLMQRAVAAWTWVVAEGMVSIKMTLFAEVGNAWISTVDQQMGLFDQSFDPVQYEQSTGGQPDMLAPKADALGQRHTIVEQLRAHNVWLDWITDVWQAYRGGKDADSLTAVRVMTHIVNESLRDPDRLCYHPASVGCRFRFLHLALRHEQHSLGTLPPTPSTPSSHTHTPPTTHTVVDVSTNAQLLVQQRGERMPSVLRCERILRAALMWGSAPVTWYGRWTTTEAREEAAAVHDFLQAITTAQWPTLKSPPDTWHPVWGASTVSSMDRLRLLQLLLSMEADRMQVWATPEHSQQQFQVQAYQQHWTQLISTAWDVHPQVALNLGSRFPAETTINTQLQHLVMKHAADPALQLLPEAAVHLSHAAWRDPGAPQLRALSLWAPLPLLSALSLISNSPGANLTVRQYALRSMRSVAPEQVAFFLPQLVQLLRKDEGSLIADFLVDRAKHSPLFAANVISMLSSEGTPPEDAFNPVVKRSGWQPPTDTGLWKVADTVQDRVWHELPPVSMDHLKAQTHFFDQVTSISGALYPVPKDERKAQAMQLAAAITVPRDDIFIPTNPHCTVRAVIPKSATPMRSAAKVPILVAFDVQEEEEGPLGEPLAPVHKKLACIFKVGDDIRQDVLALQVIGLLKDAFVKAGLNLVLFPYGAIPTGYEQGIIEVVPHAHSRAEYGDVADGGLYEIFQREFGPPGTETFERARWNFLKSQAGYAIASFLLQAKDRHGGNLMINDEGYLIHIDFGFILGISPGGNLGFENAAFKFNHEMIQLIDPSLNKSSAFYKQFVELCVRGYLAARTISAGIMASVTMMADSGLPCFGYKEPLKSLEARFHMEMTDVEAARFMRETVDDAYDKLQGLGFVDDQPTPTHPNPNQPQYQHQLYHQSPQSSVYSPQQPKADHGKALLDALLQAQLASRQRQMQEQQQQLMNNGWGDVAGQSQQPREQQQYDPWGGPPPQRAPPPGFSQQQWGNAPPGIVSGYQGPPPGFDHMAHPYGGHGHPVGHPPPVSHPPPYQPQQQQLGSLFGTPLRTTPSQPPPPGFDGSLFGRRDGISTTTTTLPSSLMGGSPITRDHGAHGFPQPAGLQHQAAQSTPPTPPPRTQHGGGATQTSTDEGVTTQQQQQQQQPTPNRAPRVGTTHKGPDRQGGSANTASNVFREFRNRNSRNPVLRQRPVCDMPALSTLLVNIAGSLRAPASESRAQQEAFQGVTRIVKEKWPHARLELFGSAANGLSIGQNNDIDVCLVLDERDASQEHKVETVEALGPLLEHAGMEDVLVLGRARVPVVKFTFPATGTKVDITINNLLACYNTRLIAEYCKIDDRLRHLILLVKHWAKRRNIAEAYKGCLSSYCYVLMCIHCCQQQQPPILPNLQLEHPPTVKTRVGKWDVVFSDATHFGGYGTHNTHCLADLLLSFFDYWTWKHDYQHDVASIRVASGRLSKAQKQWTVRVGSERHLICIEDPFQLDHDLGRNVDRMTLETMLREFERADTLLHAHEAPIELLFKQWEQSEE